MEKGITYIDPGLHRIRPISANNVLTFRIPTISPRNPSDGSWPRGWSSMVDKE